MCCRREGKEFFLSFLEVLWLSQYVLTFNRVLNKVRTINQNLNLNTLSLPYHLITAAIFSSLPLWPIFGVFLGFFVQEEKKKKVVASN